MNTPASLPSTHLLQTPLDLSLTAQATSLQPREISGHADCQHQRRPAAPACAALSAARAHGGG